MHVSLLLHIQSRVTVIAIANSTGVVVAIVPK